MTRDPFAKEHDLVEYGIREINNSRNLSGQNKQTKNCSDGIQLHFGDGQPLFFQYGPTFISTNSGVMFSSLHIRHAL